MATTGRQGFERAQAVLPDLILLDVTMPDMDGFTACRLLQASPRTCDIPIIFLTAAGDDRDRLEGLQHGGVDYVVKPFLPAEIVARIRIHLHQSMQQSAMASPQAAPPLSPDEVILRAAKRFIFENLADLPALADIAHGAGTYDKKLSRIFRRELGMTVFTWAREERLQVASSWLADSDMRVADIADHVGFHSSASFVTAFRKRMGQTPGQYRQNL